MVSKLEVFQSWLMWPVYAWQGLAVLRRVVRLFPPPPHDYVSKKTKGKEIKILTIGDSSVAGLGVDDFDETVAGICPHLVHEQLKRPVSAKTFGNSSITSGELRDHVVPNIAREDYDYIIILVGINDAKNFHTGSRFRKEFGGLLYALHARFPTARLIWPQLLELQHVPLFPNPLNKIIGIRSQLLNEIGHALCEERLAESPILTWDPQPAYFSRDDIHCSYEGYLQWAKELARVIGEFEEASPKK